jgi:hypothetical protein
MIHQRKLFRMGRPRKTDTRWLFSGIVLRLFIWFGVTYLWFSSVDYKSCEASWTNFGLSNHIIIPNGFVCRFYTSEYDTIAHTIPVSRASAGGGLSLKLVKCFKSVELSLSLTCGAFIKLNMSNWERETASTTLWSMWSMGDIGSRFRMRWFRFRGCV